MLRRACAAFSIVIASVLAAGCSLDTSGASSDVPLGDTGGDSTIGFGDGGLDTAPAFDTRPNETAIDSFVGVDSIVATDSGAETITTPDTGPESPTCDTTACATPPAGAKRLALVDRSVACPTGFKQTDVVEAKSGDGCGCSCTLTAPTCAAKIDLPTAYSDDGSCGNVGATLHPVTSGTCVDLGFTGNLHSDFSATPPAPTGGSCAKSGTSDATAITAQKRICEPMAGACFGDVCGGAFDECIETAGACPSAYPNPHTIGTSVGVTCPPCNCTLTAGTCTGTVDFFSGACAGGSGTGTKITLAANGTCVAASTKSVQSYDYVPNPVGGAGCTPSYTTDPGTPTIGGPRTLCCR